MKAHRLDTGTEELLASVEDGGIAVLTLNRPKSRNALSDVLSPALRSMIARLRDEPDVRSIVVTGAGTAFCAGGDVKGMGRAKDGGTSTPEEAIAVLIERQRTLTGALYSLPKPTVAALPGPAVGAGLAIALACDLRIAAESAFVATGFVNVGLPGDYGLSFLLTQLVGTGRARELFFTGERVDATACERIGLVNRVVPHERLMEEALDLARRLAAGPSLAYRYMKENLDRALRSDLSTCLQHEAEGTVRSALTEDHREAVRAFLEKRKPRFRGR